MARFKATVNLQAFTNNKNRLKDLTRFNQTEAKQIGDAALKEMKKLIQRGDSPVRGGGITAKFPAYKNPSKYPGKKKPHRPVNLTLTGAFLKNLKNRVVSIAGGRSFAPSIGYSSRKQQLKEQGHAEGANDQPKRPTIPDESEGITFAPSILKVINREISKILRTR